MSNQSEAVFDALGEPVRRRIVELLRDGPHAVGQLAEQLPVGRPAVSKHLRVLGDAGLVTHDSHDTSELTPIRRDVIVHTPARGDRLDEATRLATIDDASVADGFFAVDVRPWNVVMSV